MPIETREVVTARGDSAVITLALVAGDPPSILVQILDADDNTPPTAEFTIEEAADFREQLRQLCEAGYRSTLPGRWR